EHTDGAATAPEKWGSTDRRQTAARRWDRKILRWARPSKPPSERHRPHAARSRANPQPDYSHRGLIAGKLGADSCTGCASVYGDVLARHMTRCLRCQVNRRTLKIGI